MITIKKRKISPIHTLTAPVLERLLVSVDEKTWQERGLQRAMAQASQMANSVPAYKTLLKEAGINSDSLVEVGFEYLPVIDKDNYLRRFGRKETLYGGTLDGHRWTVSTTSGSTGEPFYFPRTEEQDRQYAQTAELYLRNNFKIHERRTLYIVAFPMGAWIGGLFTYEAIRRVGENGNYDMSIITPGINKAEVIKAVQNLGDDYDQILIGSYAPFLKDIIDDGIRAGLDWQKYKLGFIFSAEGFSETFRDYVAEKTGLTDVIHDTLNHYGTVDLGTMAHETPLAILIRRLAIAKPDLYQAIFGQIHKLPTLAQYIPEQFYFESNGPSLYCSAESGVPLVRYDLKDHGGIISLSEMEEIFADHNIILRDEASKAGIKNIWNLPFVYVYERSDMSVSFFAFQVYPETVRHALHEKEFSSHLTGKFSMTVEYDDVGRQELIIHIEIKPGTQLTAKLNDELRFAITERLRKDNSEYNRTYEEYGDKIMPKLQYWNYEDNTHFRPGTKQKWVKK